MLFDHIGAHFFPDDDWWRLIGRLCVPIWFFLIGYARSRDIPPRWIYGSVVLVVASVVAGGGVFPLSILPTMILIRLLLDKVMAFTDHSSERLWILSVILVVLIIPTSIIMDYGSQGLLLAMLGYMVRHRADQGSAGLKRPLQAFAVFSFFAFVGIQQLLSFFPMPAFVFLAASIALIFWVLLNFRPRVYENLTLRTPRFLTFPIRLCGRYSLEIYVVHLALFKIFAAAMGLAGYAFLEWSWLKL